MPCHTNTCPDVGGPCECTGRETPGKVERMATMTPDQIRRVHESIAACERYITREERRRDYTRPASASSLLADYRAHVVKLRAMLASGEWEPEAPPSGYCAPDPYGQPNSTD